MIDSDCCFEFYQHSVLDKIDASLYNLEVLVVGQIFEIDVGRRGRLAAGS